MHAEVILFPSDESRHAAASRVLRHERVEDVERFAVTAAEAALAVRRATLADDTFVRRTAVNALGSILEFVILPTQESKPRRFRILHAGFQLEQPLVELRHKLSFARKAPAQIHELWTSLGLAITLSACWAIVTGHYTVAAVMIAVRVLTSLLLGYDSSMPFETAMSNAQVRAHAERVTYSRSGVRTVVRCFTGHVCDVLPLFALGSVLVANQRPLWAYAVLGSAVVMLLSTLFRLSGLQVGTPMSRLSMERLFRICPLLVALVSAAYLQNGVPETGVPAIAIAAIGPVVFGVAEILRAYLRLRYSDLTTGEGDRSVVLSVLGTCGIRTFRSELKTRAS